MSFIGVSNNELSGVTAVTVARTAANGNILFIVGAGWNGGGIPAVLTLTDSSGETIPAATITEAQTDSRWGIWIVTVAHGGSSDTWTLTASGANSTNSDLNLDVLEYSGLTGVIDGTPSSAASGSGVPTSVLNTGNTVTANANDLLFTAAWDQSNGQTFTYSGGFTGRNNNQNTDGETTDEADQTVSATGTYSNTFTGTQPSNQLFAAIIAMKLAAVGPPIQIAWTV